MNEPLTRKIKAAHIIIGLLVVVAALQAVALVHQGGRRSEFEKNQKKAVALPQGAGSVMRAQVQPLVSRVSHASPRSFVSEDPWEALDAMNRRVNSLMQHAFMFGSPLFQKMPQSTGFDFTPAIDLEETKDAYIVKSDLTGKTEDELEQLILSSYPNDNKRQREYAAFLTLNPEDLIAVNNTNDGLFGIGRITSGYYFKPRAHNTGTSNTGEHYNHFHDVEWLITDYLKRTELIQTGETGWAPYGIITLYPAIPDYVLRALKKHRITVE